MRMTASWSGPNDPAEYRYYAVGRQNSGKSTSPTTEPRERPMHDPTTLPVSEQTCSREDCATLFVSFELSRSTWVATSLALGSRKMSKHMLVGGDGRKLLDLLARLKTRAEQRIAAPVKVVVIHEVGLDGFWLHRLLEANGVESHVVDPASIAVPRRHRRAKTDAIDGETLLRTLMAWQRGEPRVCAMTVPPSPREEDCRRVSRERATLLRERIQHTNRIRGLLFGQGITNYNPLHKNRRECLEELRTGDGRSAARPARAGPADLDVSSRRPMAGSSRTRPTTPSIRRLLPMPTGNCSAATSATSCTSLRSRSRRARACWSLTM